MSDATHANQSPIIYEEAQDAQRSLVKLRQKGSIPDTLWLLEHPLTLTWGATGGRGHLLLAEEILRARGVSVCKSDRGGDVTCHEPGQLVGYPIVDLSASKDRDLHAYLRSLEQGIMDYLGVLGIRGRRVAGRTGVWIDGQPARKVAALGVRVTRWIASHGFALNVENDLKGFDLIVPCGIRDATVTSLRMELGEAAPPWTQAARDIHRSMEQALGRPLECVVGRQGLDLLSRG